MNPAFESLNALAPDALLGLMTAYRADPRTEKFDLGVGVYKDDEGHTPIMSAVAKAEALILTQQTTKVYEGPRGNPEFCAAIERFVFGDSSHLIEDGRLCALSWCRPDETPRRENSLAQPSDLAEPFEPREKYRPRCR